MRVDSKPDQDVILPENILTVQELAERLKDKPSHIYAMTRPREDGKPSLPVLRTGRYLRFDWIEVCKWLKTK